MKTSRLLGGFLLAAGLAAAQPSGGLGPFCSGTASTDVALSLTLAAEPSKPLDPKLTLSFHNSSGRAVALARPLLFGHSLFLSITRDGKQALLGGSLVSSIPGQPLILQPGARYKLTRHLRHIENFALPEFRPGRYMIAVCYRNPGSLDPKSPLAKGAAWPELVASSEIPFHVK